MNFNTECATNATFQKVGGIFGIFKQALENRPNEFHSICESKDVATKICYKQLRIEQPVTFEGPMMSQ